MSCPHDDEANGPEAAAPRGDDRENDVIEEDDASDIVDGDDGVIEILGYSAADEAGVRIPEAEAEVDLGAFAVDVDVDGPAPASPASKDIQALESRAAELQAQVLRSAADFDNFRKRIERDRAEERKQAAASLVRSLLPVLDSFRRALAQAPSSDSGLAGGFLEGMRLINAQLFDILKAAGLEEVDTSGAFDPNVHEALMQDTSSSLPHLAIVEVFETGFRLGGRLLRPARVKVSWKPGQGGAAGGDETTDAAGVQDARDGQAGGSTQTGEED